jgi:hypothetical protein
LTTAGVRVGQGEFAQAHRRAFDKELHGGIGHGNRCAQAVGDFRHRQGRQTKRDLAGNPDRLAARGENTQPCAALEERLGEQSSCVDEMLAIVQHNQHVAAAQQRHEAWERVFRQDADPECGCKSCRYQLAVGEGREIDEAYAVWQPRAHAVGDGQCDRGLADAPRARDCDQPLLRKSIRQRFHDFGSTEQPHDGQS